jgi:hypothetical protein
MQTIARTLCTAAAFAAAAGADIPAAEAQINQGVWLSDTQSKCYLLYTDPQPADSVTWTGACADGGASGKGTATFMNGGRFVAQVSGKFMRGAPAGVVHAAWADGSHYDGNERSGRFTGQGTLTTAEGDRFDGTWADGHMNGRGSVVWVNGDRYDGDWRDNKAEGQGVQTWADGRKYQGAWKNDLPNGHGVLTRKDGSTFDGEFADGEPKPATVATGSSTPTASPAAPQTAAPVAGLSSSSASNVAAEPSSTATTAASANASTANWVDALVGLKLLAVDGSTLSLASADGGLSRQVQAPDGSVNAVNFTFLNGRQGTVADPQDLTKVVGIFRLSGTSLDVDYADGASERLSPASGGIAMMRHDRDALSCAAWYPEGHAFSAAEKEAALAAYAAHLGLQTPRPAGAKSCAEQASIAAAPTPRAMATAKESAPASHQSAHAKHGHKHNNETAAAGQPTIAAGPAMMASLDAVSPIEVRSSPVHLIDPPVAPSLASGADSASHCLAVDTDGARWGLRNTCGFPVQFAWCVMGGSDERDACEGGAVAGGVSANSFDALFADSSLRTEHDLRWIACEGDAADVVPRLVKTDPPAGRCVRGHAS